MTRLKIRLHKLEAKRDDGGLKILWPEVGKTREQLIAEHKAAVWGRYLCWPLPKTELDE
jgi:hypothetical protein